MIARLMARQCNGRHRLHWLRQAWPPRHWNLARGLRNMHAVVHVIWNVNMAVFGSPFWGRAITKISSRFSRAIGGVNAYENVTKILRPMKISNIIYGQSRQWILHFEQAYEPFWGQTNFHNRTLQRPSDWVWISWSITRRGKRERRGTMGARKEGKWTLKGYVWPSQCLGRIDVRHWKHILCHY